MLFQTNSGAENTNIAASFNCVGEYDINDFSLVNERINYEDINAILSEQRNISLDKIKSILSALHS